MRAFKRTLLATAVTIALATSGAASAQFSNGYFFGDSLTDTGSFKPVLPPAPACSRPTRARSGRPISRSTSGSRRPPPIKAAPTTRRGDRT